MSKSLRVLVAMSGGVDSAVAAALLHRQGYDVVGVTLRLYTEPDETAPRSKRACCGIEDVADARASAQRIGIPHYVLNMEREFGRDVIAYFVDEYAAGRTPNPCLACNRHVKFSTLLDRAQAMGFDLLATGHYARIERSGDRHRLLTAFDEQKDQSYVLYTLGQEALARMLFPLGELPKAETRRIAAELGLPVAEKPDSTDICFIPRGDYRELLAEHDVELLPGPIVTGDGTVVGRHDGVAGYTIGQRKGLGGTATERRFVTAINATSNMLVVGTADDLASSGLRASDPCWVAEPPAPGERLQARVRYHAEPEAATVTALDDDGFTVHFARPVRAVAPGQAVVLYRGDEVVGGGTIEQPIGHLCPPPAPAAV